MFNSSKGLSWALCFALAACVHSHDDSTWKGAYASNTPYAPQQDVASYEPAPSGYQAVFTQLVARHGSRAATSETNMLFLRQLVSDASGENALTDLGRKLDPQVESLQAANAVLGFGNLSGRGVAEHQQLAVRLSQRLPDLFAAAAAAGRHVRVLNSGKDRAVDSSINFAASLGTRLPSLAPLIDPPVSNTDLLYFHKAPQNADYQQWLASDPTLHAKLDAIIYSAQSHAQARRMLEKLFRASFVDRLAAGQYTFRDPKTGELLVWNDVDASVALYTLYAIAPGLSHEGTWNFDQFLDRESASWFAYLADAGEFYGKGPSFAGSTITFEMAQVLQDDFFRAVEDVRSHRTTFVATLRFAHAEIVIPFAALMQLPYSDQQVPASATYSHDDNPWRGDLVTPYAVNVQWDVYSDARGDYLVRMLYNEGQMRFKSTCRSIRPGSYFYSFDELKRCYGYL